MSSPYIQVELDALKKAPLLASAVGIQLREAVGGLALMWAHVYATKTNTVTAFYLRAFFGVDGTAEALVELGFIDPFDGGWRVRGAGRYTRLSETRRLAGSKGGQASAQAKAGFAQANVKQNDPSVQASDGADDAKQTPSKTAKHQASAQANAKQTAASAEQNQALEPIADSSLPTGERTSGRGVASSSRAEAGPPLTGAGTAAHGVQVRAKPEKPPRPKLVEGTPEYREAVAMGDYEALQWGPYAPKAVSL